MVRVGSFEMSYPEESFWEIFKYFKYLTSEYGYCTKNLIIGSDFVSVSYYNTKTKKLIRIEESFEFPTNKKYFYLIGFWGNTIVRDCNDKWISFEEYALNIRHHYFNLL